MILSYFTAAVDIVIVISAFSVINTMSRRTRASIRFSYVALATAAAWHSAVLLAPTAGNAAFTPIVHGISSLSLVAAITSVAVVNRRTRPRGAGLYSLCHKMFTKQYKI